MSQNSLGSLIAAETSGAQLAALLRNWQSAIHSMHSGQQRPTYAEPGLMWLDTSAAVWIVKIWTGVVDVTVARINPTTGDITLLQAAAPSVMMRTDAGAGPLSALPLLDARAALSDLPLIAKWDAADLAGLAQILFNIPDEYTGLEIRFSGLRSTVNASLFLLRCAVAPSGTPISTASAYQASIMQLRGTAFDTVTGSYSEFGLLDLSNSQSINHGVIRVSPDNGHWRAQIFASGLNAADLSYVSTRHGRLNAGTLCRRLQLGFSAALASSGWLRFYGVR